MADDVNGYVVRWTDDSAPIRASGFLYATEAGNVSTRRERAALFPSIGEALDGARTCDPGRPDRETIFRVYADGREERLPSYEEALAEIDRLRSVAPILNHGVPAIMHSSAPASREEIGAAACQMLKAIERALSVLQGSERMPSDPLAALEAAEQRLLVSERWTPDPGEPMRWRSSTGRLPPRDQAVSIARQTAKKGGA